MRMATEVSASRFDFDSIAEKYDSWYTRPRGIMYDRIEKKAVRRLLPKEGKGLKLLDIGCGTGHWSRFFCDCGFEVTGVDASQSMLDMARSKNILGASFQLGDARALPFGESEFDVATLITTLEFVQSPEKVITEAVRCLRKPGGILIIAALNDLAEVNIKRKNRWQQPYAVARYFSLREIKNVLSFYGEARVSSTAFVPETKFLLPVTPVINKAAEILHLPQGAVVVGKAIMK